MSGNTVVGPEWWTVLPKEHLVKYLSPRFTLHFDPAVSLGGQREIRAVASIPTVRAERQRVATASAVVACLYEIEAKIQEGFGEGRDLFLWPPDEYDWCSQPQFVKGPVRMFLSRQDESLYLLNMSIMAAAA